MPLRASVAGITNRLPPRMSEAAAARPLLPALLALLLLAAAGCGPSLHPPGVVADPNPIPAGSESGRTLVSWDTGDGSFGEVYVSVDGGPETLFAGGASGSQHVPWIVPGRSYEFRLYRGTGRAELLGSVKVERHEGWVSRGSIALLLALAAGLVAWRYGRAGVRRRLGASRAARLLAERVRSLDPSFGSALYAFALTRFVVLVVFLLTVNLVLREPETPGHPRDVSIVVAGRESLRRVEPVVMLNDARWYATIAADGYERRAFDERRQSNWAFFPLYPLLWRYASALTGELPFTGMALSNLFLLAALVLLHRLVRQFGYAAEVADRSVFYVAAFPSSYFFSLPWTESLFLCLSVGSIYAAKRDRWWAAGAVGALATATRVSGLYLIPVLLILYVQRHGPRMRASALSLLLVPAGVAAFALYLYVITGNPLAFKDILVTWGRRSGFFLNPLAEYLSSAHEVGMPWNLRGLNFAVGVLALACVCELLRRREWALGFYALASVFTPLSTSTLTSLSRYMAVVFPVHMALALMSGSPRVEQAIRALLIAALALMSALFAANITLAGA